MSSALIPAAPLNLAWPLGFLTEASRCGEIRWINSPITSTSSLAIATAASVQPPGAGGFSAMTEHVAFLMKDIVLFSASVYLLRQDVMRVSSPAKQKGETSEVVLSR